MLKTHIQKLKALTEEKLLTVATVEDQEALIRWLRSSAMGLAKSHKTEFEALLKELNILDKIKHLSEVAEIMDSELESYKVDDAHGKLSLRLRDKVIVQENLFDIGKFIETHLQVSRDHECFYFILGYFSDTKNYELAQFFEAAVKISE